MSLVDQLLILLGSIGYAIAGALIPVFNTEVYAVTVPHETGLSPFLVALALAVGQTVGKIPYWLAGRGVERFARLRGSGDGDAPSSKRRRIRWPAWVLAAAARVRSWGEVLSDWGRKGPWRMSLITFVSALIAIPPFIVWPVAVGAIDRRFWRFAVPAIAGRTILFWILALSPSLLQLLH